MAYEDYEPVAVRLDRWLKDHPDGRVITYMVTTPGDDICVFKAELWTPNSAGVDVLVATGWAEEIRNSNHITKTSHAEVCETSAIGRALANAGYAGSDWTKRASREEMQKTERYGQNTRPTRNGDGPVTITNKMAGRCVRCGLGVNKGEGKAVKDESGWKTYHLDGACPINDGEEPF